MYFLIHKNWFNWAEYPVPEHEVTRLLVKEAVLYLPDLTLSAKDIWSASCDVTIHLVATLQVCTEFWAGDHDIVIKNGRADIRHRNSLNSMGALADVMVTLPDTEAHWMQWGSKIISWIIVQISTVNWMDLGVQDLRDALFIWYGI